MREKGIKFNRERVKSDFMIQNINNVSLRNHIVSLKSVIAIKLHKQEIPVKIFVTLIKNSYIILLFRRNFSTFCTLLSFNCQYIGILKYTSDISQPSHAYITFKVTISLISLTSCKNANISL